MSKYIIELDGELESMLTDGAKSRNISAQQFILDIINKYLPLTHNIDREEMAKGYEEMAPVNLELCK